MRKSLVVGLSMLSVALGSVGNAWAACQNVDVATADFVGQVCSDAGVEQRTGRWIVDDGGIFEGTSTAVTNADGSQQVDKQGKLKTPRYDATLRHSESKSATGAKTSVSQVVGDEVLPSGVFQGTSTLLVNPDGSQQLNKRGTLRSASFDGALYRTETKSATGAKTITEQLAGTWIIAPDYKLTGTYTIVYNPDGTVSVTDNRTRM